MKLNAEQYIFPLLLRSGKLSARRIRLMVKNKIKRAEKVCPYCGAKIPFSKKVMLDHRYSHKCKVCGNRWRISRKWSIIFSIPMFGVFFLTGLNIHVWIIIILFFLSGILAVVLTYFFAPVEKDK